MTPPYGGRGTQNDGRRVYAKSLGVMQVPWKEALQHMASQGVKIDLSSYGIPKNVSVDEFCEILNVRGDVLNNLYNRGSAEPAVLEALAICSPDAPYGGSGEPVGPTFQNTFKKQFVNAKGEQEWPDDACPTCAHNPVWTPAENGGQQSPSAAQRPLYRNQEGAKHNPRTCGGRKLCCLTCGPAFFSQVLVPDEVKLKALVDSKK